MKKNLALFGLCLLAFTAFLDYTIVNTSLPFIQKAFKPTVLKLQWVTNVYGMMTSMLMIVLGNFTELFGRKKVFYLGCLIFGFASVLAGLSQSINLLIFARALQGVGGATIFTSAVTLLNLVYPKKELSRAISIYTGMTGIGLAAGPFVGGFLITFFSWRAVFFVNIPIILIGLILCFISVPKEHFVRHTTYIDYTGLILLILSIGGINYGIIHSEQLGFSKPLSYLPLIVGSIAFFSLIYYELKAPYPMLNLSVFQNPLVLLSVFSCVATGMIAYVFMFFNPLYFNAIRNYNALSIGFVIASIPLVQIFVSFFFKKLIDTLGIIHLLLISLLSALIAALLHLTIGINSPLMLILIAFFFLGVNWGVSNAGTVYAIHQGVDEKRAGSAVGTAFTCWNVAGSIALALSTVIFHTFEKIRLNALLSTQGVNLTKQEILELDQSLLDPSKAQSILKNLHGDKVQAMLSIFKHSFMSGFHWVMLFSASVFLILSIVGFFLHRRLIKERDSLHSESR